MINKLCKFICLMLILVLGTGFAIGCEKNTDDGNDDMKDTPSETVLKYRRLSYEDARSEFAEGFSPLKPACAVNYTDGGLNSEGDYALVIAPTEPERENYIALVAYRWYFTSPERYEITESELAGLDSEDVKEAGFILVKGLPDVPVTVEHFAGVVPVAFVAYTEEIFENEEFTEIIDEGGESTDIACVSTSVNSYGDLRYVVNVHTFLELLPHPPYTDGRPEFVEYGFRKYYYASASFAYEGVQYSVRYPLYSEIVHFNDEDYIFVKDKTKAEQFEVIAGKLAAFYIADFFGDDNSGR